MSRLEAIDQFRGFAILLMIIANYMGVADSVPAWLKHAPDIGYTIIDLVAPMFVFAIGLTYGLSFQGRLARIGPWRTYSHFISRYWALIGLGYLITLAWELSGINPPSVNWGLLQALGAAGLLTLVVIRLRSGWRWLIGLGLLFLYQWLLDRYWLADVLEAPHNGPWGALSWGAMLILSTALADTYFDETSRRFFPWAALLMALVGLGSTVIAPISKTRASTSYVLLSLGLSALVFFVFHRRTESGQHRLPILTDWGRNPLLLYLLHYVLLGVLFLPPLSGWYETSPLWLVLLLILCLLTILSWIGLFLNQRKLYFVL